ncbi:helix-turn-helix transcriptional regulator [Aliiroseovarius sp. KMU-50]|uniref:Helix-turn-helix transcriptional regulator n=1 Tax=Aliiroseovarius salicola TaxID=3009082 RepID=A0ABT4VZI6_9RHOB|nr:helix-turn-helix transcriptional regulator [Aliiroseovarius sp. KMU-50]MDA5093665.1 helix-turn-helix transcriptional regulator [Aliiroseovarius sp. KMU-50]
MSETASVHPSVLVNGALLKADRKAAGYTQSSFSAACASVSLVTVRRAEQGHRIIKTSLQRMAAVLEQPIERYFASELSEKKNDYVISVEGKWTSYFVETDHGKPPYLVEEAVEFFQHGSQVTGKAVVETTDEERTEAFDTTKVFRNVVIGTIFTQEWEPPLGMGTLILASSRNNDWLEGFTSWYDTDTDRIEISRNIYVRSGCPSFEKYCEDAKHAMNREIQMFRLRKLVEAGYEMEEAFSMLSSIPRKD